MTSWYWVVFHCHFTWFFSRLHFYSRLFNLQINICNELVIQHHFYLLCLLALNKDFQNSFIRLLWQTFSIKMFNSIVLAMLIGIDSRHLRLCQEISCHSIHKSLFRMFYSIIGKFIRIHSNHINYWNENRILIFG